MNNASAIERALSERKNMLEQEFFRAKHKLGMALLNKKKKPADDARDNALKIEQKINDVMAMQVALPQYIEAMRDAAVATRPKVDREAIARALSQPSKAAFSAGGGF